MHGVRISMSPEPQYARRWLTYRENLDEEIFVISVNSPTFPFSDERGAREALQLYVNTVTLPATLTAELVLYVPRDGEPMAIPARTDQDTFNYDDKE